MKESSSLSFQNSFFLGDIVGIDNNCLFGLYGPEFFLLSNIMMSSRVDLD
jgi:hypothetical protein